MQHPLDFADFRQDMTRSPRSQTVKSHLVSCSNALGSPDGIISSSKAHGQAHKIPVPRHQLLGEAQGSIGPTLANGPAVSIGPTYDSNFPPLIGGTRG